MLCGHSQDFKIVVVVIIYTGSNVLHESSARESLHLIIQGLFANKQPKLNCEIIDIGAVPKRCFGIK